MCGSLNNGLLFRRASDSCLMFDYVRITNFLLLIIIVTQFSQRQAVIRTCTISVARIM